jgi:glucokinase-like ROK family protein
MRKSNQEASRQNNQRIVLSTIYKKDSISRADIARETELTRTTVSDIVAGLMEDGLVSEVGLSPSTGGKPAMLLKIDKNSQLIVGIDLGESEFRGALVNLRGEIVHRLIIPVGDRNGEAALDLVFTLVDELFRFAEKRVIGIGIGTPGLMDPNNGEVKQAINLDWQNLPLSKLLSERFNLPVYISNDCQVAALGEYTFGAATKSDNLILVKTGKGVGAGIVVRGELFYGDNAGAGEIGHIQISQNGDPCRCGNQGCLETVLSTKGLVKRTYRCVLQYCGSTPNDVIIHGEPLTIEKLISAYHHNDKVVTRVVEEAAAALGTVIAHIVGVLNVNRILISGNLIPFGNRPLEVIHNRIQNGTLPAVSDNTSVEFSSLGKDIVILGAASLILKKELGLM